MMTIDFQADPVDSTRRGGKAGFLQIISGLSCAVLLAGVSLCSGQDFSGEEEEPYGPRPQMAEKALEQTKKALKKHKGNKDMLVLPGLTADRKARRVEVLAEPTGLQAEEILEFLLVDQSSSHGYEALLWSFAKPSDVHKALEFIGLKPGQPFNPNAMRFWASGDRVMLSVVSDDGDEQVPIERLILDEEAEKTLPEEGFVFSGSGTVVARDGSGKKDYIADIWDPKSVASVYNEPSAVLDVPRQAAKDAMYGKQVVNPEYRLSGGRLVKIVMEPGETNGIPAALNFELSIGLSADASNLTFRLTGDEDDKKPLIEAQEMRQVLEKILAMGKDKEAPFLKVLFSDKVPVGDVSKACIPLAMMETMGMIRIEPPAEGGLYYRAFVPEQSWRKPEVRPSQPWELHLKLAEGKVKGKMVYNQPVWSNDSIEPTFKIKTIDDVSTPENMKSHLDADAEARKAASQSQLPSVLLVFADADISYGQVMAFLKPVLKTNGTIYVFAE